MFHRYLTLSFGLLGAYMPHIALAHGEVDDGHTEEPVVTVAAGASALMKAGDPKWFLLLAVSIVLIVGLSYLVMRYLSMGGQKSPGQQS